MVSIVFTSCNQEDKKLPILGPKEVAANTSDTIYHTIPDFSFTNQDGNEVTGETFKGKVYVSDFFFTTCPTICPVMKLQMLRIYETFKGNPKVKFLSHSIDPVHDSVPVLKDYAERLEVNSNQWHFVTGDKEAIFDIAQTSYLVSALEDESEPGGVVHSGAFALIDAQKRVRGYYDGTNEEEVDELIKDIEILLKE